MLLNILKCEVSSLVTSSKHCILGVSMVRDCLGFCITSLQSVLDACFSVQLCSHILCFALSTIIT
jgi:hypothetical protein